MIDNTKDNYRMQLQARGLDNAFIDDCLALFSQQVTTFSSSAFVTFAVRQHRLNKQSLSREEVFIAKASSSNESSEERLVIDPLPATLDQEWLPEVATLNHLQALGFSLSAIFDQVLGFIFYYNSRLDKPNRYSVDMQFVYHMQYIQQKELAEQTEMMEKEVQSRVRDHASKMRKGWGPCATTFAILQNTYFVPELIAVGYVDEFVLYWEERQELPKGGSWKTAFIQYAAIRHGKEEEKWRSQQRKWKTQPRKKRLV